MKRFLYAFCTCLLAASPAIAQPAHNGDDGTGSSPGAVTAQREEFAAPPEWMDGGFAGGAGGGQVEPSAYADRYLTKLAIRSGISTLGTGASLATNLPWRIDVRFFGNYTDFNWKLNQSGFYIVVNIGMTNTGALVDYYPWKRWRVSPGFIYYNTDRVKATLTAQPGATFTLNNITYTSDNANPMRGVGRLVLGGTGFMATTGWGNIVSRNEKHWHFPFEAGAAFISKPVVYFSMFGNICEGGVCEPAQNYPNFTNNLNAQVADFNKRVAPFHIYPLLQGGVSYTFRYRR